MMTTFDLNRYFSDVDGEVADAQTWLNGFTPQAGDKITITHGDNTVRMFVFQYDAHGELVAVEQHNDSEGHHPKEARRRSKEDGAHSDQ